MIEIRKYKNPDGVNRFAMSCLMNLVNLDKNHATRSAAIIPHIMTKPLTAGDCITSLNQSNILTINSVGLGMSSITKNLVRMIIF